MQIKLRFLNNLDELVENFLFCTDLQERLNKYANGNDLTEKGKKLLYNNILDTTTPHEKPLNMIQIEIKVYDFPRSVLYELSTHRHGLEKLTKSTRFTLGRIAKESDINSKLVSKYYYVPENDFISSEEKEHWIQARIYEMETIKLLKNNFNMSNDKLKKYVNDYMLCNTKMIISATAIRNLFVKRVDKSAFYQFRDICLEIYKEIPDYWKPYFNVYKYVKIGENLYKREYFFKEKENEKI